MPKRKAAPVLEFKAIDEAAGTFEAIVSVFGNVDHVGDRVMPGAFAGSIERWKATGDPVPVIWSHVWGNPFAHIGEVLEMEEREKGLWARGQLDVDEPFAAQVYKLLRRRRVKEFSFAYDIVVERRGADGKNELVELEMLELGPTLKGCNPDTELLDVKSVDLTAALITASTTGALDDVEVAAAGGAKAWVSLAGSIEAGLDELRDAALVWATETFGPDLYWLHVEATFDDRLVVLVERWEDPASQGLYYELAYSRDAEGALVLGEAREVAIEGRLVAKAGAAGTKAGRRNSAADTDRIQQAHDLLTDLGATCGADDDDSDAKRRAKGAAPEELVVRAPADVRLLVDLEELSAPLG